MRRPTLDEKRYGPGFRPGPSPQVVIKTYKKCAVENCDDPIYGTAELFIDDVPPAVDWYTTLLRKMVEKYSHSWVTIPFCEGHLKEVIERAEEVIQEPGLWAPGRENPPVLPRPPKLLKG
jgi:hypothetical protein